MTNRANLLFIQSDNHNRQVSGCYGHRIVKTPTLDKLAGGGVRFANSYSTSALCCPARAAMATGRYPHQTGYWDNAIAYDGRMPSWMRRLRDQGHTVVGIGKLHYRSSDDDNGFSEELMPMHLLDGKGAIKNLLRGYVQCEVTLDAGEHGRRALEALCRALGRRRNPLSGIRPQDHRDSDRVAARAWG